MTKRFTIMFLVAGEFPRQTSVGNDRIDRTQLRVDAGRLLSVRGITEWSPRTGTPRGRPGKVRNRS
jgi:hypothetical protein